MNSLPVPCRHTVRSRLARVAAYLALLLAILAVPQAARAEYYDTRDAEYIKMVKEEFDGISPLEDNRDEVMAKRTPEQCAKLAEAFTKRGYMWFAAAARKRIAEANPQDQALQAQYLAAKGDAYMSVLREDDAPAGVMADAIISARDLYAEALKLDPDQPEVVRKHVDTTIRTGEQTDDTVKQIDGLLAKAPGDRALTELKAYALFSLRQIAGKDAVKPYQDALETLIEGQIKANPKDEVFQKWRCELYKPVYVKVEDAKVDAVVNEALTLFPDNPEVVDAAGDLAYTRKRWDLLRFWSDKLIGTTWSEDLTRVQFLAIAWFVEDLKRRMKTAGDGPSLVSPEVGGKGQAKPTSAAALAKLPAGLTIPDDVESDEFRIAQEAIDQALMLDWSFPAAWALRATADLRKVELNRALFEATQAIQLRPDDPTYYRLRGDIWTAHQYSGQAMADYRTALKLMPKDAKERPDVLLTMTREIARMKYGKFAAEYATELDEVATLGLTDPAIPVARFYQAMGQNKACTVIRMYPQFNQPDDRKPGTFYNYNKREYEDWLSAKQSTFNLFEAFRLLMADPSNRTVQALVVEKGNQLPNGFKWDAHLAFQRAQLLREDAAALNLLTVEAPKELKDQRFALLDRFRAEVEPYFTGAPAGKALTEGDFDPMMLPNSGLASLFEMRASWLALHGRYADACRDASLARIVSTMAGDKGFEAWQTLYVELLERQRDGKTLAGDAGYLKATQGLSYSTLMVLRERSLFECWYALYVNAKANPTHPATALFLDEWSNEAIEELGDLCRAYMEEMPLPDVGRMRAIADTLLNVDESNTVGLYARAYLTYRGANTTESLRLLDEVLAADGSDLLARRLRGRIYLTQGLNQDGLVDLAIGTQGDFSLPSVAADLASIRQAEASIGDAVKAMSFYGEKSYAFYEAKDYLAAAALQIRGRIFGMESRAQIRFDDGERAFLAKSYFFTMICYNKLGDNERVAKYADLLFKADPNSPNAAEAYNGWLNALQKLANREEQERVARAALQTFPQSADFWVHLGYSMAFRKRVTEAREALDKALQYGKYGADYYYFYAYAMEGAEQPAVAIEMLTMAIQKAPAGWTRLDYCMSMLVRLNQAKVTQLAADGFGTQSKVTLPPKTPGTQGLVCDAVLIGWDHKAASVLEVIAPDNLLNIAAYDRIDQRDDHLKLVMMGQELEVEAKIGRTYKSPSGKQIAIELMYPDKTTRLAINGVLTMPFSSLDYVAFSQDDSWLAAVKTLESPVRVTVWRNDGTTVGTWDLVFRMQTTKEGEVRLIAKKDANYLLYDKGAVKTIGDSATNFVVTQDARHYSYTVKSKNTYSYVYDGTPFGPYDSIVNSRLSMDGLHTWALAANLAAEKGERDTYFVIVDGKVHALDPEQFRGDRPPVYWLNDAASGWAVYTRTHDGGTLCHNGKRIDTYKNISTVTFSDDGTHIAFQSDVDGEPRIVVDGVASYPLWPGYTPPADKPDQQPVLKRLILSPDGRRVAWSVQAGSTVAVVERDKVRFAGEHVMYQTIHFSANSKHLVLFDLIEGRLALRIENEAWGMPYTDIFAGLAPNDVGGLRFIALNILPDGRRVFQRVEIPLH